MYSTERLEDIFDKNDGHCRHCGIQLAFKNYGDRNTRGGWEVDHSVPKSRGGSENLRNLWSTCWACNLHKSTQRGTYYDKNFEPRSLGGKIVEAFGGRAGDWGTDPHRDYYS